MAYLCGLPFSLHLNCRTIILVAGKLLLLPSRCNWFWFLMTKICGISVWLKLKTKLNGYHLKAQTAKKGNSIPFDLSGLYQRVQAVWSLWFLKKWMPLNKKGIQIIFFRPDAEFFSLLLIWFHYKISCRQSQCSCFVLRDSHSEFNYIFVPHGFLGDKWWELNN